MPYVSIACYICHERHLISMIITNIFQLLHYVFLSSKKIFPRFILEQIREGKLNFYFVHINVPNFFSNWTKPHEITRWWTDSLIQMAGHYRMNWYDGQLSIGPIVPIISVSVRIVICVLPDLSWMFGRLWRHLSSGVILERFYSKWSGGGKLNPRQTGELN